MVPSNIIKEATVRLENDNQELENNNRLILHIHAKISDIEQKGLVYFKCDSVNRTACIVLAG